MVKDRELRAQRLSFLSGDEAIQSRDVQRFDHLDFPRREPEPCHSTEGVEVLPTQRRRPPAGRAAARRHPIERLPEIGQRRREWWHGEFGLDLRPALAVPDTIEQGLQRFAMAEAILVAGRQPEFRLGVGDQLFAEAFVKDRSSFRNSSACR